MRFAAFLSLALVTAAPAALDPAQLAAARELYGQRKDAEALAAYQKLATEDARAAEPAFYLGLLAMRRDDPEAGVKFLEQAVARDAANAEYHRRLGDAYGRTAQKAGALSKFGWAKKSLASYQKAVALDPASIDARLSLMGFYQMAPGIAGGAMEKAYAQAEEIRKLDAGRGRLALSGLYVTDKKYAEAFALFQEVLREAPDDYGALFQLGRLSAVTGDRLELGAAALRKCLAATPPPDQPSHAAAHWRLGNIREKQGDKAAARASYESSLQLDPNFRPAQEALKALR
ncbi:MAG TPA: tetratricopeptide repeat protein [Opitutaceae bacterium]|nr:tetratricopeptide repeat protein [Opitutaceae bacterium]